jgi:hypothetical protein
MATLETAEAMVAISLDPKPLVPLYPVQPDRQPTYPRVLGPVFVGHPFRVVPAAPSGASDVPQTGALLPGRQGLARMGSSAVEVSAPSASLQPSYLQPAKASFSKNAPSRNGAPGGTLDLLA